jgi:hypothetical protein
MKVTIDLVKLDDVFHLPRGRRVTAVIPGQPDRIKPDREVDLGHVGYGYFPEELALYLDNNVVELITQYAELTRGNDDATVVDGVPSVDAVSGVWPDTGIVTTTLSFNSQEDFAKAIYALQGIKITDIGWSERLILLDGELPDSVVLAMTDAGIPFEHETRNH